MFKKFMTAVAVFGLMAITSPAFAEAAAKTSECTDPKNFSAMLGSSGFKPLIIAMDVDKNMNQFEVLVNSETNEVIVINYNVNKHDDPISKVCFTVYGNHVHVDNDGLASVYDKYMPTPK